MKKTIITVLCIIITVITFSSCRETVYNLSDSEIEKLYPESSVAPDVPHPDFEKIAGVYDVYGTSETSDAREWDVYIQNIDGKLAAQILKKSEDYKPISDETLKTLESSYDPQTGIFKQKYINDSYVVSYNSVLSVEDDGRIKLDIISKHLYFSDNKERNGANASGFKVSDTLPETEED